MNNILILSVVLLAVAGGYFLLGASDEDIKALSPEMVEQTILDTDGINTLPKFGGEKKTPEQIKLDQDLIDWALKKAGGDARYAAEQAARVGWDYFYNGDSSTAMKRFNQAWLLDPTYADAYWGMAVIVGNGGDDAQALELLEEGLTFDSNNVMMVCNKGMFHYRNALKLEGEEKTKNLEVASNQYEKGISIEENNGFCIGNLAFSEYELGNIEEAKNYTEEAQNLGIQFEREFLTDLGF
jgi:tetratricopeptide (TPR) repeat protein